MGKGNKPPRGLAAFTESATVPPLVSAARLIMTLGFAAAVPVILDVESGRRLFWAAAIAALPLLWVIGGYHLWRRICPLAVVSQLGRLAGAAGRRRVRGALARHYMALQLGLMVAALSSRLIATNGDRVALAGFIILVAAAAALTGFVFSGKTWCNFMCPVGMVEKIYTEPSRLLGPRSSACKPCTACKKNCPDIDLEQGYWRELDAPARRLAYFAWPGIVLGFYVYFYLVAGSWDYYFSGAWTLEDLQASRWLGPGLTFLESVPVVVAAPLTLLAFGAASFVVFAAGERAALRFSAPRAAVRRAGEMPLAEVVRHRALALAGLVAFLTFYFFGGQPTVRMLPGWVGALLSTAVVLAAAAIFFRRWSRLEPDFVKERFAAKILARWEWGDEPPSDDLQDIYLVHHERTRERRARLAAYKETVRDLVADGLVGGGELAMLEGLRAQLGIGERDHKRVIGELSEEERQLFDPAYRGSLELRLQREQYRRELGRAVLAAARAGRAAVAETLAGLRDQHQVSEAEEAEALAAVLGPEGPVADLYREQLAAARSLAAARRAALAERVAGSEGPSASYELFRFLCAARARERLDAARRLLAAMRREGGELAERLAATEDDLAADAPAPSEPSAAPLVALVGDVSPHLRAAAVHLLTRFDEPEARAAVLRATEDDEALVREAAFNALRVRERLTRELLGRAAGDPDPRVRATARAGGGDSTGGFATLDAARRIETLTTLETMMLLRRVPLFAHLEAGDLEDLSRITGERRFEPGQPLCRRGEPGDEVFLVVSGEVEAWTDGDGGRRVLGTSGAGACIGEMAALDSAPRSANVTAVRATRTLVLGGSDFRTLLHSRPTLGQRIIADLVGRLRRMIGETDPT